MQLTRVDTAHLKAVVDQAVEKLQEVFTLLDGLLVVIGDEERVTVPRTREGFDEAARSFLRAIADYPTLSQVAELDAAAVLEDLDNVKTVKALAEKVAELNQRLADSRLVWLGEALLPVLVTYGLAKSMSRTDPGLRTVLAPMAEILANRRPVKSSSSSSEGE